MRQAAGAKEEEIDPSALQRPLAHHLVTADAAAHQTAQDAPIPVKGGVKRPFPNSPLLTKATLPNETTNATDAMADDQGPLPNAMDDDMAGAAVIPPPHEQSFTPPPAYDMREDDASSTSSTSVGVDDLQPADALPTDSTPPPGLPCFSSTCGVIEKAQDVH